MKTSIACIAFDGEKILVAHRNPTGQMGNRWEFPGGKVEEGETPQEALKREIEEELETEIEVGDYLTTIEHNYPKFHLSMKCYWARIIEGKPVLLEHEAARWLSREELDSVAWLPADVTIIELVKQAL